MSADIEFDCQHCGMQLSAESAQAGQRFACPRCKGKLIVPAAAEDRARVEQGMLAALRELNAALAMQTRYLRDLRAGMIFVVVGALVLFFMGMGSAMMR